MERRSSIADHVLPRVPRATVTPPVVPSFDELWPADDFPAFTATPASPAVSVTPAEPAPVATVEPAVVAPVEPLPVVVAPVEPLAVEPVAVAPVEPLAVVAVDEPVAPVVAFRSDTRPAAVLRPAPMVDHAPDAEPEFTTFPAAVVGARGARERLAAPVAPDAATTAPSPAREGRIDPREMRMLGARHEARHQAARTDVDGLHDMMKQLLAARGSDLHLTVGVAPTMRVHGDLRRIADHGPLGAPEVEALLRTIVDGAQWHTFEQTNELDFAYTAPEIGRFRVNLYRQRGVCGAAFRAIPTVIPELGTLGLPPQVAQFADLPRGLVLVTGPTGSGKTTTLAALLALASRTRSPHIVTIEDPIEFLHDHGTGLVNQREVGGDTASFAAALKHALRQDPDVILVGELRDLETTATALTAAETGHLVFATLHTQSAAQTVDRVIDIFPAHQQGEVRAQLASTLRGVVTQALAPRADGSGRAVVAEIMVATPAVRNLIREGKTHQIPSFMQAGGRDGMLAFDQHLAQLVRSGVVAFDKGLTLCHSPEEFGRLARTVSA